MRKYTLAIALLVLALTAGWASADPVDKTGTFDGSNCWRNTLNLTQDQQEKITDLQKKYIEDTEGLRTEMRLKRLELRNLYLAETPDTKKIDRLGEEIQNLRDKEYDLAKDFRDKARAVLTAEQLEANPYAFMGPGSGSGSGRGGHGYGGKTRGGGSGWGGNCPR
jgi:Spy/CpxP family protein refolding chaperone